MRKEWLEKDYYAVLGVAKDADPKAIKKAYRALAQQYHPDANPGDAAAEARFKEINEAYEVVGDAEQRTEYDHVREMGWFVGDAGGHQQYVRVEDLIGQGGFGPLEDLLGGFGSMFSRTRTAARPGRDLATELSLTFHEAIGGVTRELAVNGSRVKVKIPAGVDDGARIRVRGKGAPGSGGGPNGDLFVTVHVAAHPIFERHGRDLGVRVPIRFTEAALGAEIAVPTLDGKVRLRIPPGTSTGKTFRVRGRGVATGGRTGDLLVTVEVHVPAELTDEEQELLRRLREHETGPDPRAYLGV